MTNNRYPAGRDVLNIEIGHDYAITTTSRSEDRQEEVETVLPETLLELIEPVARARAYGANVFHKRKRILWPIATRPRI